MMRLVLLLAAVVLAVWAWRSGRGDQAQSRVKRKPRQDLLDMGQCPHCGVHFPLAEAVKGKAGAYCCTEHKKAAEG
jgi:uncharacterized protein